MVKRTVLKVNICCQKCKQKLIKAVSALQGIDNIDMDAASSTLTVTGDVDPVDVICRARKAVGCAEVVSIGPPAPRPQESQRKPPQEPQKKQEEGKSRKEEMPLAVVQVPSMCHVCMRMGMEDPEPSCSIM